MIAQFQDREVDFDRVEVRYDGDLVPVEPQVFDVLSYLIEHSDRVVTKEELLDNVWGDRFVSESALTSRIKSARRAIGDNGRDQGMIKTIHGRGYRFVAPLQMVEAPDVVNPAGAVPSDGPAVMAVRGGTDAPELDEKWPLVGRHDELEQLERAFTDGEIGGVLLTGPSGIGKTRLAREALARASSAGLPTVQISGHAESAQVPLAAVSHLLPAEVLDAPAQAGDLARAVVFQRARAALAELAGDQRLVILVDNAAHLDELTTALLGSLLATDIAFAVMTQRTMPGRPVVLDELVRTDRITRIDLSPLDDTDLDVLLYRVLAGPIDLQSLDHLTRLSRGRPGALQQLVETCRTTGALERQDGVWRLTGTVQAAVGAPTSERVALDELPPAVVQGAQMLAIAGDLDLELASDLMGSDVLDELDRNGLLALDEHESAARVSLAQPHIGLLLLDEIGPLRVRRQKTRLIAAFDAVSEGLSTVDWQRKVLWAVEIGAEADRADVLAAAAAAVAGADAINAEILLGYLDRSAPGPDVTRLRAEISFRLGQIARAERLLDELSAADLDPLDAVAVRRRRATIMFHVRGRYDEAIGLLLERHEGAGGELLQAHAVGLQGFLAHADRVEELAAQLPEHLDLGPATEVLRGRAQAAVARGTYDLALKLVDEHERRQSSLDPAAAQAGAETAMATKVDALVGGGDLFQALAVLRTALPVGQRTLLPWLPIAACRAHLAAGQARAARGLILTPLAAVRSQNLMHAEPLMTGFLAEAAARVGDHDVAVDRLEVAERSLPMTAGNLRWALSASLADASLELGDPERAVGFAVDAGDEALDYGASSIAASLFTIAAIAGDATDMAKRIAPLVNGFDGPLWPVIASHVDALATGSGSDELLDVALRYRLLGYERLGGLAEAAAQA